MAKLPSSRTMSRHAKDLGKVVWQEYRDLREKYKGEGLRAREAYERACVEMKLLERWQEWKHRVRMHEAFGKGLPLTPAEEHEVDASLGFTPKKAHHIGEEEMSLPDQLKWAMKWVAKVQNGADPPTVFPCEGALFWYQSAITNRRDFERLLLKAESPGGDADSQYLTDSQYLFSEIEKQLKQILQEVGPRLRELEAEWFEEQKETSHASSD